MYNCLIENEKPREIKYIKIVLQKFKFKPHFTLILRHDPLKGSNYTKQSDLSIFNVHFNITSFAF
jgi:hypothetical protein